MKLYAFYVMLAYGLTGITLLSLVVFMLLRYKSCCFELKNFEKMKNKIEED